MYVKQITKTLYGIVIKKPSSGYLKSSINEKMKKSSLIEMVKAFKNDYKINDDDEGLKKIESLNISPEITNHADELMNEIDEEDD